jgi:hypothetical protein
MITYLHFNGNDSAQFTYTGIAQKLVCPNGVMARLIDEPPSAIRKKIQVKDNDEIIFQKVEADVVDGVIELIAGASFLKLIFGLTNTSIVLHDYCYEDFYRNVGSKKMVDTYIKAKPGAYVYDKDSASFVLYDPTAHGNKFQRYDRTAKEIKVQDKGQKIDASFTTGDIVFADYVVTDKPIDVYVNAGISLAGLKLSWSSDTNTETQEENVSFNLGAEELSGSFNNNPVRYSGQRFMKSIKLMPASRNSFAIRYEVKADFVNNGYDDIEVYDFNILTEQILGEIGGANAKD